MHIDASPALSVLFLRAPIAPDISFESDDDVGILKYRSEADCTTFGAHSTTTASLCTHLLFWRDIQSACPLLLLPLLVVPTVIGSPYIFGVCSVSDTEQEVPTEIRETSILSSGATTEVLVMLPQCE
jgi:hypothetical protein